MRERLQRRKHLTLSSCFSFHRESSLALHFSCSGACPCFALATSTSATRTTRGQDLSSCKTLVCCTIDLNNMRACVVRKLPALETPSVYHLVEIHAAVWLARANAAAQTQLPLSTHSAAFSILNQEKSVPSVRPSLQRGRTQVDGARGRQRAASASTPSAATNTERCVSVGCTASPSAWLQQQTALVNLLVHAVAVPHLPHAVYPDPSVQQPCNNTCDASPL